MFAFTLFDRRCEPGVDLHQLHLGLIKLIGWLFDIRGMVSDFSSLYHCGRNTNVSGEGKMFGILSGL